MSTLSSTTPKKKKVKNKPAKKMATGSNIDRQKAKSPWLVKGDAYTGQLILRLTDPSAKKELKRVADKATSSPKHAREYLVNLGTLTRAGNLTRKYGGR